MQIAIGSLTLNADFLIAYGCGLVILILFCMERFNQPTAADGSFIETLVPRTVSNGYRYIQAFVIYVAIMVVVYTGLSIVGPHVFAAFGLDGSTAGFGGNEAIASSADGALEASSLAVPAWVPLTILLILTGGATQFRMLNQVEFFARRLTHRLIGIPQNVESLAANIRDRRIDLEDLSQSERDCLVTLYNEVTGRNGDSLKEVDDAIEENDLLRRWLRLCFLHHVLNTKSLPLSFGVTIKQQYHNVWAEIQSTILELRSRPAELKLLLVNVQPLSKAEMALRQHVVDDIERALHDLHALIAVGLCPVAGDAVQVKTITDALRLIAGSVHDDALINRVLFALIALFFGVLASVYLSQGDPVVAFRWASGAFMLHGAAAISAVRLYSRSVRLGTWTPLTFRDRQIPTLQYLRVCLRGYLFGSVALVLWYVVYEVLSKGELPQVTSSLIWIPSYGAVAIATAFWVAYDLDVARDEQASLARRILQVLLQAVSTAAAAAFITATLLTAPAMTFQIAQTTAVAAAVLGWIAVFLSQPLAERPVPAGRLEPAR